MHNGLTMSTFMGAWELQTGPNMVGMRCQNDNSLWLGWNRDHFHYRVNSSI